MARTPKISTGLNDRPRDETIGQTGDGFPDDSGQPVEVDPAEVERVRQKLMGSGGGASGGGGANGSGGPNQSASRIGNQGGEPAAGDPATPANPDAVPAGSPLSAENVCRRCAGVGEVDGSACPDCGGSGIVTTPIGGAG